MFDPMTVTTEEMDARMDAIDRASPIIIDERRRMDAVELFCEQLELDHNVEFSDDRIV